MAEWLDSVDKLVQEGRNAVLVTVAHVRGSTPREAGAHMIVTDDGILHTIGGGNLEFKAIAHARDLLGEADPEASRMELRDYPLGPSLGQCCGGVVTLSFEMVTQESKSWIDQHQELVARGAKFVSVLDLDSERGRQAVSSAEQEDRVSILIEPQILKTAYRVMRFDGGEKDNLLVEGKSGRRYLVETMEDDRTALYLFGAGHVGQALVRMLEGLPFRITWIDSRDDMFPADVKGIETRVVAEPQHAVADAPKGSCYLVMTHDHGQDLEICHAILARGDAAYAGVIGSDTKRARFEKRLKERGIERNQIDGLVCPIGIDGISGKRPVEVALAVAAEMQITHEALSTGNREDICESNREITE